MSRPFRIKVWSSFVLSLILLAANVGAPFRTSALGRTFLDGRTSQITASAWIRVRAVAYRDVAHGFRAVVGVEGSDPDAVDSDANPRPYPAGLLRRSLITPFQQAWLSAGRPVCPLRC